MRRAIVGAAIVSVVAATLIGTGAVVTSPGPPTAVALAKVRQERPGVNWHVTAASFHWNSARVYDERGQLRESRSVSCPPTMIPQRLLGCFAMPEWVVELTGADSKSDYEAIVDVSPFGWSTGGWQIGSTPRP